jgi:hypothetical protein
MQLEDSIGSPVARVSSSVTKIVVDPSLGLALSTAGDEFASKAGHELVKRFRSQKIATDDPYEFARSIEALVNKIWREAARDFKSVGPIDPSHTARGLFVCLAKYPRGILCVGIGRRSYAQWFRDVRVAGDANNAAKFFVARFYSELKSSLQELIFLAAHVVTIGAKLAPTGVGGGLDIAICEDGMVRLLSESETEGLQQRSLEADRKMGQLFRTA